MDQGLKLKPPKAIILLAWPKKNSSCVQPLTVIVLVV